MCTGRARPHQTIGTFCTLEYSREDISGDARPTFAAAVDGASFVLRAWHETFIDCVPQRMDTAARLVLFIEDCAATRILYEHSLSEAGYRVAAAANGLDGVAKAKALQPDLIITDLDMPIMDGFEASRRIRRDPLTRTTPIIVLTGSPSRHCLVRAHEAGCDGYLTKPCAPRKLLEEIKSVLRERSDERLALTPRRPGCVST